MRIKRGRPVAMGKKRAIPLVAALCFAAGLAAGALMAVYMDAAGYAKVSSALDAYLRGFGAYAGNRKADMLRASVLKHAKLVVVMWLLAFAPAGGFAVFLLMLFNGAGYGFSTALLAKNYGASGIAAGALFYLPQCLIMTPAYCFMAYRSVSFMLDNLKRQNGKRRPPGAGARGSLRSYAASLAAGCALAVLAGLIDTFAVPLLVNIL